MAIPLRVYAQLPNKPGTLRMMGWANDNMTPEAVAAKFSLSLLNGRIQRKHRRLGDIWRLVIITFATVPQEEQPMPDAIRYVVTIMKDGVRTLLGPAQGRFTYATEEEAAAQLEAIFNSGVNSADTLRQVYGADPQPEVRACRCYPGHFDPKQIYFDTTADPRDPRTDFEMLGRAEIFRNHNCYVCNSGMKPCVKHNPRACDTLRARND